ncbi:MAG TPA: response regulator, partial [Segetibacter sp.]
QDILPSCNLHFEGDGIAALEFIKTKLPPDLVFFDLNLPLKNGIDCLKEIHHHQLLPDTPIVVYSTSKNDDEIEQCYKYGAMFYIVKPTSNKVLSRLVKLAISILGKPKSERVDKENFVLVETKIM